jgi:hypothetical protein
MSAKREVPGQESMPGMATRIFSRVRQLKRTHPEPSRRVDALEDEIRDRIRALRDTIAEFPKLERDLVTVLVINGIHKMCDEILVPEDKAGDGN